MAPPSLTAADAPVLQSDQSKSEVWVEVMDAAGHQHSVHSQASLTGWGLGEGLIKAEPSAPSGGAGVRRQVTLDLLWRLFQRESVFKHKTPAGRDSLKHSEVSEARGVQSQV